jgi:hypothetical protein
MLQFVLHLPQQPRMIAQTGAGNDWDDEGTQRPGVEHVAGHNDRYVGPNDPRIRAAVTASGTSSRDATVDAIKTDWARQKQQFGLREPARGTLQRE